MEGSRGDRAKATWPGTGVSADSPSAAARACATVRAVRCSRTEAGRATVPASEIPAPVPGLIMWHRCSPATERPGAEVWRPTASGAPYCRLTSGLARALELARLEQPTEPSCICDAAAPSASGR